MKGIDGRDFKKDHNNIIKDHSTTIERIKDKMEKVLEKTTTYFLNIPNHPNEQRPGSIGPNFTLHFH